MTKKGFGFYATIVAAALSLAAGICLQVTGGIFGAMLRNCYDPMVVGLFVGGAVLAALLMAFKRYGVAAAAVTALSGIALCMFIRLHDSYWYIADVFIAIDEKGFDPKFLVFAGLALGAFLIGEIAVFTRKEKAVKA